MGRLHPEQLHIAEGSHLRRPGDHARPPRRPSARGHVGAGRHDPLCDDRSDHWFATNSGRWWRANGLDSAGWCPRRSRSSVARDATRWPRGPVYDYGADGSPRRCTSSSAEPGERHTQSTGPRRKPRALRVERSPRVRGRGVAHGGGLRPNPVGDAGHPRARASYPPPHDDGRRCRGCGRGGQRDAGVRLGRQCCAKHFGVGRSTRARNADRRASARVRLCADRP